MSQENNPIVIGDAEFVAHFQPANAPVEIPDGVEQVPLTVDRAGNIVGDTSSLDPHLLAQLSTPEAQEQIRKLYRERRYQKEPERPLRYLNQGTQRRIARVRPKGMTPAESKAFRAACRKELRKITKAALKAQRSIHHG